MVSEQKTNNRKISLYRQLRCEGLRVAQQCHLKCGSYESMVDSNNIICLELWTSGHADFCLKVEVNRPPQPCHAYIENTVRDENNPVTRLVLQLLADDYRSFIELYKEAIENITPEPFQFIITKELL